MNDPDFTSLSIPLVCPDCRIQLEHNEDVLVCNVCSKKEGEGRFQYQEGFADLIIGGRFEDDTDETCACYEEDSNEYSAENYWIPLFKKMFKGAKNPPKLLAIGCGVGVEVDLLCKAGFDCYGIDNGNRTRIWSNRSVKNRLIMANGMHLPFEENTFDAVFCGCVFPHIGVKGDTNQVKETYFDERLNLASEMVRVLKSGGNVVACSPNRKFPFDIFHGRQPGSYKPRFNWIGNPFLLSAANYKTLFQAAGATTFSTLPIDGFWGFVRSKKSFKGRVFGFPVRFVFDLVSSKLFSFLRSSLITPWIAIKMTK